MKIRRLAGLEAEMRQVAGGEIPAPVDAAAPSVESIEALVRRLTPEDCNLSHTIREAQPQSVAELARLTNRTEPNLPRTIGKPEAFGLLEMYMIDRRRVPTARVGVLHFAIDPYAMCGKIEIRSAS